MCACLFVCAVYICLSACLCVRAGATLNEERRTQFGKRQLDARCRRRICARCPPAFGLEAEGRADRRRPAKVCPSRAHDNNKGASDVDVPTNTSRIAAPGNAGRLTE